MVARSKRAIHIKKVGASEYETYDGNFVLKRNWDEQEGVVWRLYFKESDGNLKEAESRGHATLAQCTEVVVGARHDPQWIDAIAKKEAKMAPKKKADA